jgi:ClpP class serine protease
MTAWLIDEDAMRQMRDARQLNLRPSEAQISAFEARESRIGARAEDQVLPRIMKVAGSVAQISIEGILTKTPDIMAYFFGGGNVTYRAITSSLAIAQADPAIKSVVMYVDSPGGTVDGLFETLAAIENFRVQKPLVVKAANAMSAAYGIAAVAGKIEATNAGSRIGSVGVAASIFVDKETVDITNTDSPDKRPDPTTEEGKATIRRELDAMHELFIDAIARGRGTDKGDVRENFGRGATLLAGEAKKLGMIDAVAKPGPRAADTTTTIGAVVAADDAKKEQPMDLRKLKAEHPEIFEAAFKEGATAEKDRCSAHLTMAQPGGEEGMKIAIAAIKAGEAKPGQNQISMADQAAYMTLAMNTRDRGNRQTDDKAIDGAANGATANGGAKGEETAPDLGDKVVAIMRERRGKKV